MPITAAEIAAAWRRERPGTPTDSIEVFTPIVRLAKLLTDDRTRVLRAAGVDPATLDLLSALRRSGPPYTLTTRQLTERTLVTAGAISQRVARAEQEGLVTRAPDRSGPKAVAVALTPAGHTVIERSVDLVLGRDSELVAALDAGERELLVPLLDKLEALVRARVG